MTSLSDRVLRIAAQVSNQPKDLRYFAPLIPEHERHRLLHTLDALTSTGDLDRAFTENQVAHYVLGAHHHHAVVLMRHDAGVRLFCVYCSYETVRNFPLSLTGLWAEFGALRA
jgi:hypothetical protein